MKYFLLFLSCFLSAFLVAQEEQPTDAIIENYEKLGGSQAVRSIFIDKQNFKWLGTDHGLYKMINIEQEPELIVRDSILAIAEDKLGVLWYANRKSQLIAENNAQTISLRTATAKPEITALTLYKGDLWVGTKTGLYRVSDNMEKILDHYTESNSKLKTDEITMLYPDPYGNLWVGTKKGLLRVKGRDFTLFEKDHEILAATSTVEGVWVLTNKEIFEIYEDGRWGNAGLRYGLRKGTVRAITSDSKGNLYIASEILVQFNPYTEKIIQFDRDYGFVSAQSLSLACDKNDDIWVGTADRGLFRIDIIEGQQEKLTAVAYVKGENKCATDQKAQIIVITRGGKTPYSFSWNKEELEGSNPDSLAIGDYSVTISDAEGEEYTTSVSILSPPPITIALTQNQAVSSLYQKDGKAAIEIKGGVPPYRLIWDNGRTSMAIGNLGVGKHHVRVSDANGCQQTMHFTTATPAALPDLVREKIEVGQTLRINELYFTSDSTIIDESSFPVLDEIYAFLQNNSDVVIEIGGHTNGIPAHEYCDKLSLARARNVAEYLFGKGIPENQIIYKGYGKRQLLVKEVNIASRQKNQRVEIKILEIKKG